MHSSAPEFDEALLRMAYPPRSVICTEPFSVYLREYYANWDFIFFILRLVTTMDRQRVSAAKWMANQAEDPDKKEKFSKSAQDIDALFQDSKKHASVGWCNLTNGVVNALQRYFSSIIQRAALKRPEILSSSQTIKVEEALRFSRHRDLVELIVERKVNELSYGGLTEMEKYIEDRLGIKMFKTETQRSMLKFFIEVRNINVHNGGIVNEIFLNRVGKYDGVKFKLGKLIQLDFDELCKLSANAMQVVQHIDDMRCHKIPD